MIGILADSHDNLIALRRAVRLFNEAKCSLVIHAGDFVAPFAARELGGLECPVKAVFGNCDGEKAGLVKAFQGIGTVAEAPMMFEYGGLNYFVSHLNSFAGGFFKAGGKMGGECTPSGDQTTGGHVPLARVSGQYYDVVVFGHTHRVDVKRINGALVINPGEAGGWLCGKSTVALLNDTDLNKTEARPGPIDVEIIAI